MGMGLVTHLVKRKELASVSEATLVSIAATALHVMIVKFHLTLIGLRIMAVEPVA